MCFNYFQALQLLCPHCQSHNKSATKSCAEFPAVGQRPQYQSPDLRQVRSTTHHFPNLQKGQMAGLGKMGRSQKTQAADSFQTHRFLALHNSHLQTRVTPVLRLQIDDSCTEFKFVYYLSLKKLMSTIEDKYWQESARDFEK